MKHGLLQGGIVAVASLLPNQDFSPGSARRSGKVAAKRSASPRSSFANWCPLIIVLGVVIMLGLAVAAILLGEK